MKKVTDVQGRAVPLPLNDVDTDMIIPAQFLTSVSREGFGQNLFRRLRDADETFPLNQKKFQGAEVLVVGNNFGCGSSREHAVWALQGAGFRAVIGKSFADIFSSNSGKNGLVLATLPAEIIDELLKNTANGDYKINVSLRDQKVTLPDGRSLSFPYDEFRKHCMLEGLDDIDYILSKRDKIESYRSKQETIRFYRTD